MTEQKVVIASLRKQLQEANKKILALEQEIAVLNYENDRLNGRLKQAQK